MAAQRAQPFRIGGVGQGPAHRLSLIGAEKPKDARATLRRLWEHLRYEVRMLAFVLVLVTAASACSVLTPWLIKRAIDHHIMPHDLPGLSHIVIMLFALAATTAVTGWLQTYHMVTLAQRTLRRMRRMLFNKLQALPLAFFDKRGVGDLMSRFTNDLDNISNTMSESVPRLFSGALRIAGAAAMMLWINRPLAFVTLVTVPAIIVITKFISAHTLRGYREQQEALGRLNGIIEENVTGARVIKAYAAEDRAIAEFDEANERLRTGATKAMTFAMLLPPLVNMANNMGFAVVAAVGGWMAVRGLASIGDIAAFIFYAQVFGRPLNEVANLFNTVQAALAGAERVFEVMDEIPESLAESTSKPLARIRGDVVFDNVNFEYLPNVPVLREVSIEAHPGQTIALVGPTGAGKTTLVNVLSRFYEIQSGRIQIDENNISDIRKDDLRRQLGIVLQDSFLFSDTVMENIRYGKLDAKDDEVIAAAKLANADHFIQHLPDGYRTKMGERGGNISQGQRQLIAIARAILADPAILILDEATSSVDTRTERHIQEAMRRLMAGRTSLVIAHRLSTIRDADMILVIRHGQIIERGTHEDLIARRGFYQKLYMSQFKGHEIT